MLVAVGNDRALRSDFRGAAAVENSKQRVFRRCCQQTEDCEVATCKDQRTYPFFLQPSRQDVHGPSILKILKSVAKLPVQRAQRSSEQHPWSFRTTPHSLDILEIYSFRLELAAPSPC